MDVFRYLFRGRGTKPTRGLGKVYHKVDFSHQSGIKFMIDWEMGVKLTSHKNAQQA